MATLQGQTFDGLPGGMNLALPQFQLDDTEARYIQDCVLDKPGLVRRRGPVKPATGFPTFTKVGSGIIGTFDPNGDYRIAMLTGDGSTGHFALLSNDFTTKVDYVLNAGMGSSPYSLVDAKPAHLGGAAVGVSNQYSNDTVSQSFHFWRGANKADYSTGTITVQRGSKSVAGSGTTWTTNVVPGMYLFADTVDLTNTGKADQTFIGVVDSVESNTALTLMEISPYLVSADQYTLKPIRGLQYKIAKGRLTGTTASTTITGANTKFLSQFMDEVVSTQNGTTSGASPVVTALTSTTGLKVGMRMTGTNIAAGSYIVSIDSATQVTMNQNSGSAGTNPITFKHMWNLYKASDGTWIGRVTLVNNEISITLAANSAVAMNNEKFYALCGTGDWGTNNLTNVRKPGFLNAFYAGRQWYANNGQELQKTSRVWFSETSDPEALDLSTADGDFFDVSSSIGTDTPIKALVPAYNGLVIIKENETYVITGSSPTTFSLKKVQDDGCFSGMSAQPWGGGVLWAGVDGIYFYDGITVNNIATGKLGDFYRNAVRNTNPTVFRMWGMVARGHYMLYIENFDQSVAIQKGTLAYLPTSATLVVNLETNAFTIFQNVNIRGWTETPSDTGKQILYIVNDTKANVCQAFDLFDGELNDTILCDSGSSASVHRYGVTTSSGSTAFAATAGLKMASKVTFAERAAVRAVQVYSAGQGGGVSTNNSKVAIYNDLAGEPNAIVAQSAVVVLNKDDGPEFREYAISPAVELAAGDYWLAVMVEDSTETNFYAGATANERKSNQDTYPTFGDPFGAVTNHNGPLVAFAEVLTVGPDFYIESKKFTEGDSMIKKLFKQLSLNYIVQGGNLKLDTVPGLTSVGKTSTAVYPPTVLTWDQLVALAGSWENLELLFPTWNSLVTANFKPKRIKFLKRNQMMSFRLWQESPAVNKAELGPFQILYKWQRLGRI